MRLALVQGENLRRFERFSIEPAPGINWMVGPNAAGKTTLLEAIHLLGRARSFRATASTELCGSAGEHWRLQARVVDGEAPPEPLNLSWSTQGLSIRRGNDSPTLAELAKGLPVQALEPGTHRLIEEGPGHRRRYLDWGVFHVEPSFYPAWRRYRRSLLQRNRGLKARAPEDEIASWDKELADSGEILQRLRDQHLIPLRQQLAPLIASLLDTDEWTLELHSGWAGPQTLRERLAAGLTRDRRIGQTQEGPHRAELRLSLGGHHIKSRVSRGQQKLLVAALLLAQAALIREATGRSPILLFDDFPAELGADFQARLLRVLRESECQVFASALECGAHLKDAGRDGVFHVEQGRVARDLSG